MLKWILIGVAALALVLGAIYYLIDTGKDIAEGEVAKQNTELVESARTADQSAIETIIRETTIIERQSTEIREAINEVPATNINPVSLTRAERVWEQQRAAREADSAADSSVAELPSGTTDPEPSDTSNGS